MTSSCAHVNESKGHEDQKECVHDGEENRASPLSRTTVVVIRPVAAQDAIFLVSEQEPGIEKGKKMK